MMTAVPNLGDEHPTWRISEIAALAGVSTRTLRYYEERDLLVSTGHTSGGERRYGPDDLARLQRIIELRDGLGLNLDEVKTFIDSERRLAEIKNTYRGQAAGSDAAVRQRLLEESIAIRSSMVARIELKLSQLHGLHDELKGTIARSRKILRELGNESKV